MSTSAALDQMNFTGGYPIGKDFAPSLIFSLIVCGTDGRRLRRCPQLTTTVRRPRPCRDLPLDTPCIALPQSHLPDPVCGDTYRLLHPPHRDEQSQLRKGDFQ